MNAKKTILLADDHALIRSGLRQVIEQKDDFNIIETDNGKKALDIIREKSPDIAILDIEMPGLTGFEVSKIVRDEDINIDIIFLTMYKDESLFNKAIDMGVKGYVLKENTVAEMSKCLNIVIAGNHYLSPAISDFLIRRKQKLGKPASDTQEIDLLTPTEKNILKQVGEMKTNQEIADYLKISIKTVQNHRNNICNKLEISGSHALLKFAVEYNS